jgi:hypothetical protein
MKEAVKRWIDSATRGGLLIGLVCWAAFMSFTHWAPASWWLDVQRVHVPTAKAGQPIRMEVSRAIKRDIVATWTVSIRTADANARVVCDTSRKNSNYRVGANLPDPLTLHWWTSGACDTLPPGRYWIATDWDIQPSGIWPGKRVSADSKPFEVLP